MTDYGTEADAMWEQDMSALGGEMLDDGPAFEVITGKKQRRIFEGTRAECWAFRKVKGGFVRPWSGENDVEDWE